MIAEMFTSLAQNQDDKGKTPKGKYSVSGWLILITLLLNSFLPYNIICIDSWIVREFYNLAYYLSSMFFILQKLHLIDNLSKKKIFENKKGRWRL
jgi:hypothetical protein